MTTSKKPSTKKKPTAKRTRAPQEAFRPGLVIACVSALAITAMLLLGLLVTYSV